MSTSFVDGRVLRAVHGVAKFVVCFAVVEVEVHGAHVLQFMSQVKNEVARVVVERTQSIATADIVDL